MGTDGWALFEVSNDAGATWRPMLGQVEPKKIPRDYPLFAVLADVRNRAGRHNPVWNEPASITLPNGEKVDIPGWWYDIEDGGHDRLVPVSTPRGVPDDASAVWQAFTKMWQARTSSVDVTYLDGEDLKKVDWNQKIYREGYLTEDEYLLYRDRNEIPQNFAGQVGGPGLKVVTEVQYAAGERGSAQTVIDARWNAGTLADNSAIFYSVAQALVNMSNEVTKVRLMLLFES